MKKIISTLLIASIAITGLFAADGYSNKSAILEASKAEVGYNFVIRYNKSNTTTEATLSGLTLATTPNTTPEDFTIETSLPGNLGSDIIFKTEIKTGEFKELVEGSTATDNTGKYPIIKAGTDSALSLTVDTNGDYDAESIGSRQTTLALGPNAAETEIARFKLGYAGSDDIVAGAYRSESIVTIIVI